MVIYLLVDITRLAHPRSSSSLVLNEHHELHFNHDGLERFDLSWKVMSVNDLEATKKR